jgi:hypothetical protein
MSFNKSPSRSGKLYGAPAKEMILRNEANNCFVINKVMGNVWVQSRELPDSTCHKALYINWAALVPYQSADGR